LGSTLHERNPLKETRETDWPGPALELLLIKARASAISRFNSSGAFIETDAPSLLVVEGILTSKIRQAVIKL
jgi:hypothetical protein